MIEPKTPSAILQLDHVSLSYDDRFEALNNINLRVDKGDFISIIGSSGCGKSSLLNCIAGFIKPSNGRILMHGQAIQKPGPDRSVVFQDLALFPWLTVLDNVCFGLKMSGVPKSERIDRGMQAIRMVGLSGSEHKSIADLSGGMKQRVAIARTLVTEPEIVLMDEPFSALDEQTREIMQEELLRIKENIGMTILLVTHSIEEAVYLSDKVVVLQSNPGRIADVVDIHLSRPRFPELRVEAIFTDYKKKLMQLMRHRFGGQEESFII